MNSSWQEIQDAICQCNKCEGDPRVECNIRQQTAEPRLPVRLLVIGIAPPYDSKVTGKTKAKSATNDSDDNLRKFIERSLDLRWDELAERGFALIHSVKCAIRPKDRHQNPPLRVVTKCVPPHFAQEFGMLRPSVVMTLGDRPLDAVRKTAGCRIINLRKGPIRDIRGKYSAYLDAEPFTLFVSFFHTVNPKLVEDDLKTAARLAGLIDR